MLPLIFGAVSAIGSAAYLYFDWRTSQDIDSSVSQMESYIELLNGQMTLPEFLDAAWPSLVLIAVILIGGYIVATPQRKDRRSRR